MGLIPERAVPKILLVEDHPSVSRIVADHLGARGFGVDVVGFGQDAVEANETGRYDAVILDLGLPDMDGMAVLGAMRAGRKPHIPAIILSARDRLHDRVDGLDAGADDYIVKPFDLTELEARLRAVLRRSPEAYGKRYAFADLTFEPASCAALAGGRPLALTRLEMLAFEELVRAAGRPVVKDALEDRLYFMDESGSANALEAVISRLRRRLAAAGSVVSIEALRGIGYRLRAGAGP
jgi:DNA-binding response OmpR family regulator